MCNDEPDPTTGSLDAEIITNPQRQLFEINWIVIAPTVPATYFHALRRQVINLKKIKNLFQDNNIFYIR